MTRYLVAVDAGTSMIKAVLIGDDGVVYGHSDAPVVRDTKPGIDPHQFWQTTAEVISTLVSDHPDIPLHGVVVAGQGDGLWMVGSSGQVAPRAYLWNGAEGADVVAQWSANGVIDAHFGLCGTVLWSGSQAALWAWFRDAFPADASDVTAVFCAKDMINYHLTGVVATDLTDASIPFLDPVTTTYSTEAAKLLGVEDLLALCPPIVPSGQVLGAVTAAAAAATGVPEGTPVYQGAIDVVAMLWGSGLGTPGDVLAVLGTTAVSMTVTSEVRPASEVSGATLSVGEGARLRVMGSSSGTATLEWYLNLVGYQGDDRYDQLWSDVRLGQDGGELFIPYLSGERAPILAPHATGTFLGLTPHTDNARMARAVTEGITHALRWGIDAVLADDTSHTLGQVVLAGGGSKASDWADQVANCLGVPITVDGRDDLGARGVARAVFGDIGATRSSDNVATRSPDHHHAAVATRYQAFRDAVTALMPLWSADHQDVESPRKDTDVD
jgi:erythritol kinase (D-erythritol 1-phosphate-forming)